ncbi:MAG TPA: DUF5682 family protein [Kofleriaceae bacterium]|nr:DUF5682 family protein [Kofleriaceae bacterium]
MAAPRKRGKAAAPAAVEAVAAEGPAAVASAVAAVAVAVGERPPLERLRDVAIFPVRHHSPRTSAAVRAFLDAMRPSVVMVEAPRDAQSIVPHLFDADTEPPVAILGYRTEGAPASSLWPMASYSPEYVAMRWAHEHGARLECIDARTGQRIVYEEKAAALAALAAGAGSESEPDAGTGTGTGTDTGTGVADPDVAAEDDVTDDDEALAQAHDFRSFEELWEAWFEAPAYVPDDFRRAMLAWCEAGRGRHAREIDRARDARMALHILDELAAGTTPAQLAVVVGGAHAAALLAGDVDLALDRLIAEDAPTAVTLIPYSFTRLAAQVGYGAGNRAPRYYQRAHDRGCDYTRATLEILIEFTEHLRMRGFSASLADTIEAYRLAVALTQLRGKHAPGLDELRDATVATLCRGERAHVDSFLWPAVIGHAVGKVGQRLGKNSLQDEFWREVRARRLPATDEPEAFSLKLADLVQVQASIFLHRLRLADVPYATYRGAQAAAAMQAAGDEAGGVDALARVREHWEAQWTPATDVALVERIVLGDTLQQVVERTLGDRLPHATTSAAAAHLLMEAVVAHAPQVVALALSATERLTAVDDDLASLARAARALSGLVSYGTSRGGELAARDIITALLDKTFTRAVLRVEGAASGDDDAVAPVRDAMRILHELALSQPAVDRELWFTTARALVETERVHPSCAGLLAGLLYLGERLTESEVVTLVGRRLGSAVDPRAGAAFLEGFLEVNALVLVRNRAIVAALDGFLQAVDADHFRDVVPLLRRAFAVLGATERRYLLEHLLAVRKLGGEARAAAQVLAARDVDALAEMRADLASVMDDLDDLL